MQLCTSDQYKVITLEKAKRPIGELLICTTLYFIQQILFFSFDVFFYPRVLFCFARSTSLFHLSPKLELVNFTYRYMLFSLSPQSSCSKNQVRWFTLVILIPQIWRMLTVNFAKKKSFKTTSYSNKSIYLDRYSQSSSVRMRPIGLLCNLLKTDTFEADILGVFLPPSPLCQGAKYWFWTCYSTFSLCKYTTSVLSLFSLRENSSLWKMIVQLTKHFCTFLCSSGVYIQQGILA